MSPWAIAVLLLLCFSECIASFNETRYTLAVSRNQNQTALRKVKKESFQKYLSQQQRGRDNRTTRREALDPAVEAEGLAKSQALTDVATRKAVVEFDTAMYHKYIEEGPRPYWVMLAYTALGFQYNCAHCKQYQSAMLPLAQGYARLLVENNSSVSDENLPLYFANLDVSSRGGRELFDLLEIKTAPIVVMVPPTWKQRTHESKQLFGDLTTKHKYRQQTTYTSEEIRTFIHRTSEISVPIDESVDVIWIVINMVLLGGAAFVFFAFHDKILTFARENRALFFICAWGWFLFCITGGMYNRIRHVDFARRDQSGSLVFIFPAAREQVSAESWLVALLVFSCSSMLVFFTENMFLETPGMRRTAQFHDQMKLLAKNVSPLFAFGIISFAWIQISLVYFRKNPSYLG